jgi:hypothetical protein
MFFQTPGISAGFAVVQQKTAVIKPDINVGVK